MTESKAAWRPLAFVGRAARLAFLAFQEGRLSLSPRRWLIDLRHLRGVMTQEKPRVWHSTQHSRAAMGDALRDAISHTALVELRAFLEAGTPLILARHQAPLVTVILVLFNRAELTLRCLRSLAACSVPLEVILVDNASTDATSVLLDRTMNATAVRHANNEGFAPAVNAGARAARGSYLLLLNNDAELLPGSLEAAVRMAASSPDIGAVGGKLILPNGELQEAGSLIWNDGSCVGYGRGESPFAPSYAFARDVDMCSGAFLLTPRALFLQLGGLDPEFSPAYYEDADYCVRLWAAGKRVVYEPSATVMHFEFGSSASGAQAARLQQEKRRLFVRKHATWLQRQEQPGSTTMLKARDRQRGGRRVLVFDDRVPHRSMGFGFPRAVELLHGLVNLGHFVTLYPLSFPREDWDSVYADVPRTVEVMTDSGPGGLTQFTTARRGYYDTIIVSRHHNMERLRARLGDPGTWGAEVIYDAEVIAAFREIDRRRLTGDTLDEPAAARAVREEVDLARGVNVVLAVSTLERQAFLNAGIENVVVAGHSVITAPTERSHPDRQGMLFVGAFDPLSPNQDSVLWFVREVLPRLNNLLGRPAQFTVVGQHVPNEIAELASEVINVVSGDADLVPFYDRARVFVAPTRFAAGIPLKVIHASAHGLPVVCTSLLARQLGWTNAADVLVADTAEEFARLCVRLNSDRLLWEQLRANALQRVKVEYSPEVFRAALRSAIGTAKSSRG